MSILQSYTFSHMPQISDPKSQEIHRFWAQESTIRLFLKQKGKTPENKELTAVVNLKKNLGKKSGQNGVKEDMYQV